MNEEQQHNIIISLSLCHQVAMCDMLRPVTKAVSEPPVTAAMLSSQLTPYPRDFRMASSSLSTVTFSGFLTFLFWRKVLAAPFPSLQCFSTLDHHLHLLFTFLGFSLLLSVNVLIFFSAGSLRSTDGILLFFFPSNSQIPFSHTF